MSAAGISVLILYGVIATVIAIKQWRERWVEPDDEETHIFWRERRNEARYVKRYECRGCTAYITAMQVLKSGGYCGMCEMADAYEAAREAKA
ncbi:MAG: hypothetical protein NUW01_04670 [Gemmatimonadaceae bacterium]|nr:hypothetical protein [Gemmatimonadaceae bacterium]